jgi:pilus assembly protein Flp/PilA
MLEKLWLRVIADAATLPSRLRREDGQAMVEYALILALVSVAAIATLGFLGGEVNTIFEKIKDALAAVPGA